MCVPALENSASCRTVCACVFCVILTVNSEYLPWQHSTPFLSNEVFTDFSVRYDLRMCVIKISVSLRVIYVLTRDPAWAVRTQAAG